MAKKTASKSTTGSYGWKALLLLALPLCILFRHGFTEELVLFSNDGPLGVISAAAGSLPGTFFGYWHDLNWVGMENPSALPDFSMLLGWMIGNPVTFSKLYAPCALLFLGMSAWLFGRSMQWHPWVCVLMGLAAALNSNAFSNACWGLPSRATTMASVFLALAALHASRPKWPVFRYALAGFAIGHSVLEGFDVGALYSIGFGLYALYYQWSRSEDGRKGLTTGLVTVALIVLTASWMASQGLMTLVSTQLSGAAKPDAADPRAAEAQWNFATQWSLPVGESLRVIIPGLFGYRMTDLDGNVDESAYWGAVGRDPNWQPGQKMGLRHSGSGEYAGVVVVLVALWAFAQTFRSEEPIFDLKQRRLIRFWAAVFLLGCLFAFGRHAPFYQIIYPLPFIHSIRNPIKFMHLAHLALIVLFGYGLHGLCTYYLGTDDKKSQPFGDHLRTWWANVKGADRAWTKAFTVVLGLCTVSWLIYASSKAEMSRHLLEAGFPAQLADAIHGFSASEVGMFVFWLLVSGITVILIQTRYWFGKQRMYPILMLGVILTIDLCRANIPWIQYYNYQYKYASHPVLDVFKEKAHEARLTANLNPFASSSLANPQQGGILPQIYNDWLQHAFPFHNIQSLDVIQWPRPPKMDLDFGRALAPQGEHELDKYTRLWELTSTRYILGSTAFLDYLNNQFDPIQKRFRIHTQFEFAPKPGKQVDANLKLDDLTTVIQENGSYAVFEFTGAHPRAKLYGAWQKVNSDEEGLAVLSNPDFDVSQTAVLGELPPSVTLPEAPNPSDTSIGSVEWVSYAPRKIELKTKATSQALLVLNDRFHPDWHVYIDGQEATMLRCNHLMRGVFIPEGEHAISFRFEPLATGLYAGIFAWITAIGIIGIGWKERRLQPDGTLAG